MRALAAAIVLVYHLIPGAAPAGLIGVDVFFVISGYLITRLLINEYERNSRIELKAFWLRRLRRLFPALAFMVLVCVALAALVGGDALVKARLQTITALTYTYNWAQIATGSDYFAASDPLLLTNVWSLAIEQQFYIVWPLVLLVIVRWRGRAIVPGLLAIASATSMAIISGTNLSRAYYGTDTHLFGLMIGAILAMIISGRAPRPSSPRLVRLVGLWGPAGWLAVAVLAAIGTQIYDDNRGLYIWGLPVASLASAIIIRAVMPDVTVASAMARGLCAILEHPVLVWIGARSYGLYLWHWPLLVLVNYQWPSASPYLVGACVAALSLALAEISLRYVEDPMRRAGIFATLRAWGAIVVASFRRGPHRLRGDSSTMTFRHLSVGRRIVTLAMTTVTAAAVVLASVGLAVAPTKTTLQMQIDAARDQLDQHNDARRNGAAPQGTASPKPTEPSPPPSDKKPPATDEDKTGNVSLSFIGDSVMLAASPAITARWPKALVDAEVSRAMPSIDHLISRQLAADSLGDVVIVGLATNGTIRDDQIEGVLHAIGADRRLVLVNGYSRPKARWVIDANAAIDNAARQHPDRVFVANWHTVAADHQDLLASDQTHPRKAGIDLYVKTLHSAINEAAASLDGH